MTSHGKGWLKRSGQQWKLAVFYVLIGVSACVFALFIAAVNRREIIAGVGQVELALLSIALGALGMAWLIGSIRCARCNARPVATILRTASANRWLVTLQTLERCPRCHSDA